MPHRRPLSLWPALLLALGAACNRQGSAAPRNLLLVSIDSLRADHVGCYGYARPTSPTLDRLAAEGVRFAQAQSPTSWTLPSHVSLLSGRSQESHHVLTSFDAIQPDEELLAQVFSRAGYETIGFYSGPHLHPAFGFNRGFDAYVSCESEETAKLHGPPAWESSHGDRTNPLIKERFADWLARRSESRRPFFAFVHMWDVHFDYIPPEPYASMFDPDYKGSLDGRDIIDKGFPLDAPARDVDHLRALYDGEIRYTDDTLGELLAMLDRAHLLDDTLVVVVADHGEEFLEHGGKTHQRTIFQEVVHVPLIFWARAGLPRGRAIAELVSLEDVAPTVVELLGLPALARADGQSLVTLIRGGAMEHAPVFSSLYFDFSNELAFASVRRKQSEIIYSGESNAWEEYDLEADPAERVPRPVADEGLRSLLTAQVERAKSVLAARAGAGKRHRAALPADVTERLKKLGYLR